MDVLLRYNLDTSDVADGDYAALFERRRRDACFAAVWREGDEFVALRDHLGTVPLWYRRDGPGWRFALQLDDLVDAGDRVDETGLRYFLGLGSCRVVPLLQEIGMVPPGTVMRFGAGPVPESLYRYRLRPWNIPRGTSLQEVTEEQRKLLVRALERTIRHDRVGLFLSGGVDSLLIGKILRDAGVAINAYTLARWGKTSSEYSTATTTAKIIGVDRHQIHPLETGEYETLFTAMPDEFRQPYGVATGMGVVSLLRHTDALAEDQLFFGQNADNVTCSVGVQYRTWYASRLPRPLTRIPGLPGKDILENFLHVYGNGILRNCNIVRDLVGGGNDLQRLGKTGALVAPTPSESEVFVQPVLNAGGLINSPYHDVDHIEFNLGVPLWMRIGLRRARFPLSLEKRLLQRLAREHMPGELIRLNKGMVIPLARDETSRKMAQQLPGQWGDIPLPRMRNQVAAAMLRFWARQRGVRALQGQDATPAG